MKQVFDLIVEHGKVLFNNGPDRFDIDVKVIMNEDITHSDNLKPGYIGMLFRRGFEYDVIPKSG